MMIHKYRETNLLDKQYYNIAKIEANFVN